MHTVSQSAEKQKDIDVLCLELLSHQSSELDLNQEDHMVTQAAQTVKICVLKAPAGICTYKGFFKTLF